MDLCWQSNVSAFKYVVQVCHIFSSKEQASFNFMAAVTICSDFGAPQNKVWHCFHCFPIYFHEVMGPDAMILVYWMLTFKPSFSLSSFTFIKRLFSSSSLSAIRVVSSAYLRLLIFLLAIWFQSVLLPAQSFSWCTLHISYWFFIWIFLYVDLFLLFIVSNIHNSSKIILFFACKFKTVCFFLSNWIFANFLSLNLEWLLAQNIIFSSI